MNRIRRSGLVCLAVFLLIPMLLVGCVNSYEECCDVLTNFCAGFFDFHPPVGQYIGTACLLWGIVWCDVTFRFTTSQERTDNPDECAASFEQLQLAAIQFCEKYPEECQQAFDSLVESLDEEAIR